MLTRRGLIGGLGALFVASPAIVRATSIMPVKSFPSWRVWKVEGWDQFGDPKVEIIHTYTDPKTVWGYLGAAVMKEEGQIISHDQDWRIIDSVAVEQ